MRRFEQLGYVPVMVGGAGGAAVWVDFRGGDPAAVLTIIVGAIGWSFLAERIAPYERGWNSSHGDRWRDVVHAVVNETLNVGSVAVLGVVGGLGVSRWWPSGWPFVVQVAFAIVVLDAGVTLAHW